MDDRVFSEADKLNGIEWVGTTSIFSTAYRSYKDGEWSDWFDNTPIAFYKKLRTSIRKIKGKWAFGISENDDRFVAIPCSQLPQ
jgi:hypothetical protein